MMVLDGVEMLDVREAARAADRTPETIRRWVWGGRLAAVKHGNRLLVRRADLAAAAVDVGGAGADVGRRDDLTLAAWADQVSGDRRGAPGVSAADLILEDRARR